MVQKFVNAGLVEQHGASYCSLAAASFCTLMKVRAYLMEGEVPVPPEWGPKGREIEDGKWDRCAREDWPWKNRMATWKAKEPLEKDALEEERVMRAWSYIRDMSATHLNFRGLRDGVMDRGIEID